MPEKRQTSEEIVTDIEALKQALRESILTTTRTVRSNFKYDPAGSSWDEDWSPQVYQWAALCNLDLSKHKPPLALRKP